MFKDVAVLFHWGLLIFNPHTITFPFPLKGVWKYIRAKFTKNVTLSLCIVFL